MHAKRTGRHFRFNCLRKRFNSYSNKLEKQVNISDLVIEKTVIPCTHFRFSGKNTFSSYSIHAIRTGQHFRLRIKTNSNRYSIHSKKTGKLFSFSDQRTV